MLAVLATHPIQYQAPIFRLLAERGNVPFEVWYLTSHGTRPTFDREFGASFTWDIDLLSGYTYCFPSGEVKQDLGGFWAVGLPECYRKRLRSGEVNAMFVPGWGHRACWEAVFLADRLRIPVWIRGDSNDLKIDRYLKRGVKRLLLKAFFDRVDRFLYVGAANMRLYQKYGVESPRLLPALHAVDNERFAAQAALAEPQRAQVRKGFGIDEGSFCVLFVGKLISIKRPLDILDAVKKLMAWDTGKYHVVFVGSGELANLLRSHSHAVFDVITPLQCAGSASLPRASFLGFLNQTEVSRAYAAADVLVLPSNEETWGLVVNEAMASGLPAIVSKTCACAEDLVAPIDANLVFETGNTDQLARAINYARDHLPSRATVSKHVQRYDFLSSVTAMEQCWKESTGSSS